MERAHFQVHRVERMEALRYLILYSENRLLQLPMAYALGVAQVGFPMPKSDDVEAAVLKALHEGELYQKELVEKTGYAEPTLLRRLDRLEERKLVESRKVGNLKYWSLTAKGRKDPGTQRGGR